MRHGQNIIADTSPVGVSKYTCGINLLSREYQRGAEAGGTIETVVETYLFNAHGDVVQLADAAGKIIKDYDYDAFGNPPAEPVDNGEEGETEEPDAEGKGTGTALEEEGSNQGYQDTNPFRYAGEYLDLSSGLYYLRARNYQPTTGRFLTEDTHWNPENSIYGDTPVQIGERKDPLGLNIYTYRPDINAICQSTNSYVYSMNNPIMYSDTNGKFVITTAALLIIGGAALVGTIGGFVGNYIADQKGATGWDRAGYIAGGVAIGAVGGGVLGAVAAPSVVGLTGIGALSITSTGVSTIAASTGTVGMFGYKFGDATLKAADTVREALLNTIKNPSLSNLANQLYRPNAHIGDGGTAMALMNEWANGATKFTAQHYLKGVEMITALSRLYQKEGSTMVFNDREIALKLIEELKKAVNLFTQ